SGRSIQKSYKKGNEVYYSEVGNRYKNGELASDGENVRDSVYDHKKTYTTKSGKLLYGGGGIMPDVYIPIDTSGYTDAYYSLAGSGAMNDMVFNYLVSKYPKYGSPEEILKNFRLTQADVTKIIQLAEVRKVRITEKDVQASRKEIERQLRALLT